MQADLYLNFDLRIERTGSGYRSVLLNSPVGEATCVAPLPLPDELAGSESMRTVGSALFEALFRDEVLAGWRRSLDAARAQDAGLRLRLRLGDTPELAGLPWESLYDPDRDKHLALSSETPVVRYLEMPEPARPLDAGRPLTILVMIANPSDLPALEKDREWENLQSTLGPLVSQGKVTINLLGPATTRSLQNELRRQDYHVLHFLGHGAFDGEQNEGLIVLEDDNGRAAPLSARKVAALLSDHPTLRLVMLNACQTGASSPRNPHAGTAQQLVSQGIPAVIAMRVAISDAAAVALAESFYAALADGMPVDGALAEARKAVYASSNSPEWATPVLFLRSPDGRLWNFAGEIPAQTEETDQMVAAAEQPWWREIAAAPGENTRGDTIIAEVGAGARGVVIGKNQQVTQSIYDIVGEPQPDDRQVIKQTLAALRSALHDQNPDIDPSQSAIVDFQMELLAGELTKTEDQASPSANTIIRVAEWLLDHNPSASGALSQLFSTPAVARVLAKSGEEVAKWVGQRF